jgi:hypothetical protein
LEVRTVYATLGRLCFTLVRCLLLPATMRLLGDANWWAPAPLRRLYDRHGMVEAPAPRFGPPGEDAFPVDAAFGPGW